MFFRAPPERGGGAMIGLFYEDHRLGQAATIGAHRIHPRGDPRLRARLRSAAVPPRRGGRRGVDVRRLVRLGLAHGGASMRALVDYREGLRDDSDGARRAVAAARRRLGDARPALAPIRCEPGDVVTFISRRSRSGARDEAAAMGPGRQRASPASTRTASRSAPTRCSLWWRVARRERPPVGLRPPAPCGPLSRRRPGAAG